MMTQRICEEPMPIKNGLDLAIEAGVGVVSVELVLSENSLQIEDAATGRAAASVEREKAVGQGKKSPCKPFVIDLSTTAQHLA
jgi:hypothetical protein